MTKWRMTIDVDEDIIRRYHELTPEDPEADQTVVGDWISDLVIDAREAHRYAQKNPGPDVGAAAELLFARAGTCAAEDCNFIFVKAERLDDDAADTPTTANEDSP